MKKCTTLKMYTFWAPISQLETNLSEFDPRKKRDILNFFGFPKKEAQILDLPSALSPFLAAVYQSWNHAQHNIRVNTFPAAARRVQRTFKFDVWWCSGGRWRDSFMSWYWVYCWGLYFYHQLFLLSFQPRQHPLVIAAAEECIINKNNFIWTVESPMFLFIQTKPRRIISGWTYTMRWVEQEHCLWVDFWMTSHVINWSRHCYG